MASVLQRHYGNQDWNLGEQRFARLHIYATLAALNGDVSTAQGRAAYCIESDRVYFGKTGAWVGLANASSWQDPVATVGDLPVTDVDGTVRVVLDDSSGVGPTIWMYTSAHGGWHKVADPRMVLSDGTVKFTAIPGVASGAVVPSAATDLVTKAYADVTGAALAAHLIDAGAHAAAIAAAVNSGISTHNADGSAHAATIAAAVASGVAPVTADLAAHKIDGSAHAAAIAAAVSGGITTHLGDPTAHATEIASAIAVHNADPSSHAAGIAGPAAGGGGGGGSDSGGADGAFSHSGQNIVEDALVISGGHGSPCVTDPLMNTYRLATPLEEPVGLIWRKSTKTTVGSQSVTFSAGSSNVTILDTTGIVAGMVVSFPSSVLNAGIFFFVSSVPDSTHLNLARVPVNETVATTMDVYTRDGIIQYSGKFLIDLPIVLGTSIAIQSVLMADGDGRGNVVVSPFDRLADMRAGDQITIAGTPSNNGTYTVHSVIQATNTIVITGTFPANQGVVGTLNANHLGQSNNYATFTLLADVDLPFYIDDGGLGYSQTKGVWGLGVQINNGEFVIRIQRVNKKKISALVAGVTLTRRLHQVVPVDTTGGTFDVTLFVGVEGDQVDIVDYGGALNASNCRVLLSGGQTIGPGADTSFYLDTNGQAVTFKFLDGKWRLL